MKTHMYLTKNDYYKHFCKISKCAIAFKTSVSTHDVYAPTSQTSFYREDDYHRYIANKCLLT